jgi:Uma2 family endonuclease
MTSAQDILPTTTAADLVTGPPKGKWTYDDYAALPDNAQRYEVLGGVLLMTPAPNLSHQNAVTAIATYLRMHMDFSGRGKVYASPIDVRLTTRSTVVQPDVVLVLTEHQEILTAAYISGTPDLVVEVTSPGTATYDRRTKMDAYAQAGVPEYWIADPDTETVELFTLRSGTYGSAGVFRGRATLPSVVVPDLTVTVEQFFA